MHTHFWKFIAIFNRKEAHTHFADFEQVIIKIKHFADFEQIITKINHFEQLIIKISHFSDLEQVKEYYEQNSQLCKTPLRETGCLGNHDFISFTAYLSIQFFDSPLPPYCAALCDLQDVMPRHWLPAASHPSSLTSSLTLPWAIARFLDPFYTFSSAHRRVIHDFVLPTPPCDLGDTMPRQRPLTLA